MSPIKVDFSKDPDCPLCGAAMTKRRGRLGEFWSCVEYPECKGARPVGPRDIPLYEYSCEPEWWHSDENFLI